MPNLAAMPRQRLGIDGSGALCTTKAAVHVATKPFATVQSVTRLGIVPSILSGTSTTWSCAVLDQPISVNAANSLFSTAGGAVDNPIVATYAAMKTGRNISLSAREKKRFRKAIAMYQTSALWGCNLVDLV